jgi:DNA polymerase (family 10)
VTNLQVLGMLAELARLTSLEEGSPQAFKVRAYENAVAAVEGYPGEIAALDQKQLEAIKGLGASTAAKIRELVDTGTVAKLEELRTRYPAPFVQLMRIPGLGPKTLLRLRDELGVEDLASLQAAISEERLRNVAGLGKTTEEKLAKAIERLGLLDQDRRTPIADALPVARQLASDLRKIRGVEAAEPAGSLRRFAETIGDIDIVVAAPDGTAVMEAVSGHALSDEVILSGPTKTSIRLPSGMQVDVRVVEPDQMGAALLYFTGSKAHNIALRQRAIDRGWLLNEYGLFDDDRVVASKTETEVYAALGTSFIPPPLRENSGEIQAAAAGELPEVVTVEKIRGDLHFHSDQSGDGRASLEEMVEAAARRGLRYVGVTEHGEDLTINGSSRDQMRAHRKRIEKLQEKYPKLRMLFGCELNIGPEGGLDYDPDFRLEFEWCVASIHSHFDLPSARQTERVLTAISDPSVSAIGHLTGRYIGRRPGVELNVDAILDGLREAGVALEVNGALDRLDASAEVIHRAVAKGVKLVISTDSHHPSDLARVEFGVLNAQRGWAQAGDVVNTLPTERFLKWARARRV